MLDWSTYGIVSRELSFYNELTFGALEPSFRRLAEGMRQHRSARIPGTWPIHMSDALVLFREPDYYSLKFYVKDFLTEEHQKYLSDELQQASRELAVGLKERIPPQEFELLLRVSALEEFYSSSYTGPIAHDFVQLMGKLLQQLVTLPDSITPHHLSALTRDFLLLHSSTVWQDEESQRELQRIVASIELHSLLRGEA